MPEKMSEWMPDTMLKQYVTVGITRSTVILVETNLPPPICQGLCLFTGGYVRKKHLVSCENSNVAGDWGRSFEGMESRLNLRIRILTT